MAANREITKNISFEDYLGLTTCLVEWADSYDTKNWDRLRKCIAPTLRVRTNTSLLIQIFPKLTN